LLEEFSNLAAETGCSMAQLAIAWLLEKDSTIIPIPGTTSIEHMIENAGASSVVVSADVMVCLDKLINQETVTGARYTAGAQQSVDTEEFA